MTKVRQLLLAALLTGSTLFIAAPPAHATCQTNPDLGDMCKAIDTVLESPCHTHKLAATAWELATDRC